MAILTGSPSTGTLGRLHSEPSSEQSCRPRSVRKPPTGHPAIWQETRSDCSRVSCFRLPPSISMRQMFAWPFPDSTGKAMKPPRRETAGVVGIRGCVVAGESLGVRAVRAHLPKVITSVMNRGIDNSSVRRPCQTVPAVAVLVSGAREAGFGLLAGRGDLDGRKNLLLQGQQRLSVRARPDSRCTSKGRE